MVEQNKTRNPAWLHSEYIDSETGRCGPQCSGRHSGKWDGLCETTKRRQIKAQIARRLTNSITRKESEIRKLEDRLDKVRETIRKEAE